MHREESYTEIIRVCASKSNAHGENQQPHPCSSCIKENLPQKSIAHKTLALPHFLTNICLCLKDRKEVIEITP